MEKKKKLLGKKQMVRDEGKQRMDEMRGEEQQGVLVSVGGVMVNSGDRIGDVTVVSDNKDDE